jgi:hypothetical protein
MKIRLYPAVYQEKTDTYKCEICGWDGYPELTGGWCPTDRIMCEKCGPNRLVEVEV